MRIVYKYEGLSPVIPHPPVSASKAGESVIVISSARKNGDPPEAGKSFSGDGYDVRISDEALSRDNEVRSHERAHLVLLGSAAASGIIFDTVTGPAGEKIAVGGRIKVDLAEVPGDPAATLRKARSVISAANAPHNPSAADMRTAAKAYDLARKAQEELGTDRES